MGLALRKVCFKRGSRGTSRRGEAVGDGADLPGHHCSPVGQEHRHSSTAPSLLPTSHSGEWAMMSAQKPAGVQTSDAGTSVLGQPVCLSLPDTHPHYQPGASSRAGKTTPARCRAAECSPTLCTSMCQAVTSTLASPTTLWRRTLHCPRTWPRLACAGGAKESKGKAVPSTFFCFDTLASPLRLQLGSQHAAWPSQPAPLSEQRMGPRIPQLSGREQHGTTAAGRRGLWVQAPGIVCVA